MLNLCRLFAEHWKNMCISFSVLISLQQNQLDALIFSNLFWKWNSTCFGQFLCPSSGVIHCSLSNGICHTDSFRAAAGSGWNWVPAWSCSKAVYKPVWHIPLLSVQWITPDDGQRNCPKHVEFHFRNKFEKISASSWFYCKEICHDARSHERKKKIASVCLADLLR
jgi:hypothetical protein